jgi:RNA polymerase sigma factor (sigma-70 family)
VEAWVAALQRGSLDAAWDLFVDRYRKLIFAAIRHYAQDHDDVMDVFAQVCEVLRENDLRRLRSYVAESHHRARFSTWLVTVVRNLTIDWFRARDGRRRLSAIADALSPVRRRIFELVFLDQRSHVEAYELLRTSHSPELSFREFLVELRATYRACVDGQRGRVLRELGGRSPPADDEDLVAESLSAAEVSEAQAALRRALEALKAEDRAAVELYIFDEVSAEVVAKVLGLANAKAVYNRVYRALEILRARLGEAGIGAGDL